MEAVASLRAAARHELRRLRGGDLHHPGAAQSIWVGELDSTVVGYLTARHDELPDGRRIGTVEELYVDPACRAVGVGEAMMSEALAWFSAAGCPGVDAAALPGARATKNFFEESGFTARLLVMHRPFQRGDDGAG